MVEIIFFYSLKYREGIFSFLFLSYRSQFFVVVDILRVIFELAF